MVEPMTAAYAASTSADDPLSGLVVGEVEPTAPPAGWVPVTVRAAALNHHDLWSLRGVGLPAERLPMVLGCDAAGVDPDGNEVIVHAVITDPDWTGPEVLDPRRSLLSEHHPGTLAETVWVPRRNLVPKPAGLSFVEAACLPTAWLTAYTMITEHAGVRPGDTILVQGVGGGVASAAVRIAVALGMTVYATSRDEGRRRQALDWGATAAVEPGDRLPRRVDAVIETVGAATWSHSIRSLRPGGTLVIAGATSGDRPDHAELTRIFFQQLRVQGATMGDRHQLERVARFCVATDVRPVIDRVLPLARAAEGFAALAAGDVVGKVVLEP